VACAIRRAGRKNRHVSDLDQEAATSAKTAKFSFRAVVEAQTASIVVSEGEQTLRLWPTPIWDLWTETLEAVRLLLAAAFRRLWHYEFPRRELERLQSALEAREAAP
jgi:hypothetical protein